MLTAEYGEHADDGKDSCGKTNKVMIVTMQKDIDQVGKCCSQQHAEQSEAVSAKPAEKVKEESAKETVPQEVCGVGMKSEGCDESIPFTIF